MAGIISICKMTGVLLFGHCKFIVCVNKNYMNNSLIEQMSERMSRKLVSGFVWILEISFPGPENSMENSQFVFIMENQPYQF